MCALARNVLAAFTLAACAVVAGPARAEPGGSLVLVWRAPNGCPQEAEFRGHVERLLRQPLAERREQNIAIAGMIQQSQSGELQLLLQVGTVRGNQKRELTHSDCRELTEAGALVTALAIDPSLVVESEPVAPAEVKPEPTHAPTTEPPAAPPPSPPPPVRVSSPVPPAPPIDRPETTRGVPFRPSMVLLGIAGNGVMPGVGAGGGAQLAGGTKHFRVAARGVYWLDRFQPISGFSGPGVTLRAWALGLRACGLPVTGSLSLWGCLGVDAGLLRGKGEDVENASTKRERWSAATAELVGVYTAPSGLMTQLGFELGRALEMPRFGISVDGQDQEVFRANEWIAQASLGIGFSFDRPK